MPEAIGNVKSPAFQPSLKSPRTEKVAEQAEAVKARRSAAAAETVRRQADFSSNRTEFLSRQAEQLQDRAQNRNAESGLGSRVDIRV
ncbi:hypothetical protein [Roseibium sp.]|uniref:hypothetical protein n=1 Tax=Roseibium sp. TaxID=1936156 RepID=UPI003D09F699